MRVARNQNGIPKIYCFHKRITNVKKQDQSNFKIANTEIS